MKSCAPLFRQCVISNPLQVGVDIQDIAADFHANWACTLATPKYASAGITFACQGHLRSTQSTHCRHRKLARHREFPLSFYDWVLSQPKQSKLLNFASEYLPNKRLLLTASRTSTCTAGAFEMMRSTIWSQLDGTWNYAQQLIKFLTLISKCLHALQSIAGWLILRLAWIHCLFSARKSRSVN